jgi:hypothetical protein
MNTQLLHLDVETIFLPSIGASCTLGTVTREAQVKNGFYAKNTGSAWGYATGQAREVQKL